MKERTRPFRAARLRGAMPPRANATTMDQFAGSGVTLAKLYKRLPLVRRHLHALHRCPVN